MPELLRDVITVAIVVGLFILAAVIITHCTLDLTDEPTPPSTTDEVHITPPGAPGP